MVGTDGEGDPPGRLLDTSLVIAAIGQDPAVIARLRALPASSLFLSATVLGELLFGALVSSRVAENIETLVAFASVAHTLPCDAETARFYGDVKAGLKRLGRPIPENDVWIAAVARQHRLTLVTRDAHFAHVDDLRREHW
jgi:tRNA(fMet)-specific endonuclease VapC